MRKPNVLFVMTDQQRWDTIAALGNGIIRTPNMDRLVRRGVACTNAYTTCPVCLPARYTIRTGREPARTGVFNNPDSVHQSATMEARCGTFLARQMGQLGYRTFGIGKFHTRPWDQDVGFETQLHSEELYEDARQRQGDAFARFIRTQHPEYDWIDMLQGERAEMYYVPQMSPLPEALTVESWAADRAVEQLARRVGINRRKLALGFKILFGETVGEYQRDVRLEFARRMLEDRTASVTYAATVAGYSDVGSFGKAFKAKYGWLPSQSRPAGSRRARAPKSNASPISE